MKIMPVLIKFRLDYNKSGSRIHFHTIKPHSGKMGHARSQMILDRLRLLLRLFDIFEFYIVRFFFFIGEILICLVYCLLYLNVIVLS